jgi:hypothetical protein
MRKRRGGETFRITGARRGLTEDVRSRERRYVISMSVRTVSVVLAAVLWNVERHVAVVAVVLGMLLPYVSVVIANAGRESPPSLPSTFAVAPPPPVAALPPVVRDRVRPEGRAESGAERAEGPGGRPTAPDGAGANGERSRPAG